MSAIQIMRRILATTLLVSILLSGTPANAEHAGPDSDVLPQATAGTASSPVIGNEIVVSALNNEQLRPDVAYNTHRGEYLVVWQNNWPGNRDIYGQRIAEDGDLRGWFAISAGPNDRAQPSVAYDPNHDRYLVTWIHDVNGNGSNWDVRGRVIPWDGPSPTLTEFVICDWTTTQRDPKVVYALAQDEFMVVWWTAHSTVPAYVSGRRISAAAGGPADSAFAIAHHPSQERIFPEIAYNLSRNEYLVTYHNGLDVFGARLQGNGNILAGGEFGIAGWPDAETSPVVASCDQTDQYLVAWQSLESGLRYNIYVRFITGDGVPDSVHHLVPYPIHQRTPDIACGRNSRHYVVTWEHQYSNITGPYGIWGRMISSEKHLGDAFTLVAPAAGVLAEFTSPATAGGRTQFLTVWEHDRAGTTHQDIHGRLAIPFALYIPLIER